MQNNQKRNRERERREGERERERVCDLSGELLSYFHSQAREKVLEMCETRWMPVIVSYENACNNY